MQNLSRQNPDFAENPWFFCLVMSAKGQSWIQNLALLPMPQIGLNKVHGRKIIKEQIQGAISSLFVTREDVQELHIVVLERGVRIILRKACPKQHNGNSITGTRRSGTNALAFSPLYFIPSHWLVWRASVVEKGSVALHQADGKPLDER